MDDGGWRASAAAWIADVRRPDEFGRRQVLDPPMLSIVRAGGFSRALDVGCGEGRFCRMMRGAGIASVTGLDPTIPLLQAARASDSAGEYVLGRAEDLPFANATFDLVVSYLTLIDIPDAGAAIDEMARVLAPGGLLLIANLASFLTAAELARDGKVHGAGQRAIDGYLEERDGWLEWRGVRIRNWHRPLALYMTWLLGAGLQLVSFDEPAPVGGEPERVAKYRARPWFIVMAWRKPASTRPGAMV